MPGRGPAPTGQAVRRNVPDLPTVELGPAVGADRAPALPHADRYGEDTVTWYQTWCDSPQTSQFTGTDWQRLHMLAPLVEAYFKAPTVQLMTEIRLQEKLIGGTVGDRFALRWKVPRADAGQDTKAPRAKSRERADPRKAK